MATTLTPSSNSRVKSLAPCTGLKNARAVVLSEAAGIVASEVPTGLQIREHDLGELEITRRRAGIDLAQSKSVRTQAEEHVGRGAAECNARDEHVGRDRAKDRCGGGYCEGSAWTRYPSATSFRRSR